MEDVKDPKDTIQDILASIRSVEPCKEQIDGLVQILEVLESKKSRPYQDYHDAYYALYDAHGFRIVFNLMFQYPKHEIIQQTGCAICLNIVDKSFPTPEETWRFVISAMHEFPQNEKIQLDACTYLSYISVNAVNIRRIQDSGASPNILRAMKNFPQNTSLQEKACIFWRFVFLDYPLELLDSNMPQIVNCLVDASRNHPHCMGIQQLVMSCFAEISKNQRYICNCSGGEEEGSEGMEDTFPDVFACILQIMHNCPKDYSIQLYGCSAIKTILQDSEYHCRKFGTLGGPSIIVNILKTFGLSTESKDSKDSKDISILLISLMSEAFFVLHACTSSEYKVSLTLQEIDIIKECSQKSPSVISAEWYAAKIIERSMETEGSEE